jgi:hypothetical protein
LLEVLSNFFKKTVVFRNFTSFEKIVGVLEVMNFKKISRIVKQFQEYSEISRVFHEFQKFLGIFTT